MCLSVVFSKSPKQQIFSQDFKMDTAQQIFDSDMETRKDKSDV